MKRLLACMALGALLVVPRQSAAHGINGHIWVTDGGIDRMADCEFASELLGDPELRAAIQIGASFPDSGYALDLGREYGETAHWEPFVDAFIRYMRTTYKPPYDTFEEKRLIAFLMGLASHGMEDEVFDSIFLWKSFEAEGTGQELLDPGTDFMLISEGVTKLKPDIFLPADDLLAVYADPEVAVEVDAKTMEKGMFIIRNVVIALVDQDETLDDQYRPQLPWTAEHYLDPQTPGSLAWEKAVIGPYLDAIWHRLHDDFRIEDVVVHTVPAAGERLLSNDASTVDSWINVIFGYGVWNRSLTAENIRLVGPDGKDVAINIAYTRWGNASNDGRMVQLRPKDDLTPDATYKVIIGEGLELIDGRKLGETITLEVKTACAGECAAPKYVEEAPFCSAETGPAQPVSRAEPALKEGGCNAAGQPAGALWLAALVLFGARRLLRANA